MPTDIAALGLHKKRGRRTQPWQVPRRPSCSRLQAAGNDGVVIGTVSGGPGATNLTTGLVSACCKGNLYIVVLNQAAVCHLPCLACRRCFRPHCLSPWIPTITITTTIIIIIIIFIIIIITIITTIIIIPLCVSHQGR